jgi:hypothetical protein
VWAVWNSIPSSTAAKLPAKEKRKTDAFPPRISSIYYISNISERSRYQQLD